MSESVQTNLGSGTLLRSILAVAAGVILWMIGFFVLARILVLLWPAYAVPARLWIRTGAFTFTTPMALFNVTFWILAEFAAGWIVAVIGRRAGAVWVLAALVMGYLCFLHLYYAWHVLPSWYNLMVAISSGPAVLLGGRFGAGSDRTIARVQHAAS